MLSDSVQTKVIQRSHGKGPTTAQFCTLYILGNCSLYTCTFRVCYFNRTFLITTLGHRSPRLSPQLCFLALAPALFPLIVPSLFIIPFFSNPGRCLPVLGKSSLLNKQISKNKSHRFTQYVYTSSSFPGRSRFRTHCTYVVHSLNESRQVLSS